MKLNFSAPIQKVDQERRIVSGFATVDSPDTQGDIIPLDVSVKAFEEFRGNVRLMHQPIPAGKVLSFKEGYVLDEKTQSFFGGVEVEVYVSKGAQNVWEMVLDGTLTGFSIGGVALSDRIDIDENGEAVRVIEDLQLHELSLVDNPANQLANIMSISKSGDVEGFITKTNFKNVFYCKECKTSRISIEQELDCSGCEKAFVNIGWVDDVDSEDTKKDVVKLIDEYKSSSQEVEGKGGENMSEEVQAEVAEEVTEESVESVTEEVVEAAEDVEVVAEESEVAAEESEVVAEDAEVVEEPAEAESVVEEVESSEAEAAEVSETSEVEDEEITALTEELVRDIVSHLLDEKIESVTKALAETHKVLVEETSKVVKIVEGFAAKNEELSKSVDGLKEEFVQVNEGSAIKKSVDVESTEQKDQGVWKGAFAPKHLFDSNSIK